MSRTKTTATQEVADKRQPAYVTELLDNGTVTITAKTREKLAEMVNDIPADCSYGAGAVSQNRETGMLSLRLDLKPNKT